MVNASLGVSIRSIEGSEDKLRNNAVLSSEPLSSNCLMKKFASSLVIPIAAKTTEKFSSVPRTCACLAICDASWLCGRPDAEKIGNF